MDRSDDLQHYGWGGIGNVCVLYRALLKREDRLTWQSGQKWGLLTSLGFLLSACASSVSRTAESLKIQLFQQDQGDSTQTESLPTLVVLPSEQDKTAGEMISAVSIAPADGESMTNAPAVSQESQMSEVFFLANKNRLSVQVDSATQALVDLSVRSTANEDPIVQWTLIQSSRGSQNSFLPLALDDGKYVLSAMTGTLEDNISFIVDTSPPIVRVGIGNSTEVPLNRLTLPDDLMISLEQVQKGYISSQNTPLEISVEADHDIAWFGLRVDGMLLSYYSPFVDDGEPLSTPPMVTHFVISDDSTNQWMLTVDDTDSQTEGQQSLEDGTHTLTIVAADRAGNTSTTNFVLVIDRQAPSPISSLAVLSNAKTVHIRFDKSISLTSNDQDSSYGLRLKTATGELQPVSVIVDPFDSQSLILRLPDEVVGQQINVVIPEGVIFSQAGVSNDVPLRFDSLDFINLRVISVHNRDIDVLGGAANAKDGRFVWDVLFNQPLNFLNADKVRLSVGGVERDRKDFSVEVIGEDRSMVRVELNDSQLRFAGHDPLVTFDEDALGGVERNANSLKALLPVVNDEELTLQLRVTSGDSSGFSGENGAPLIAGDEALVFDLTGPAGSEITVTLGSMEHQLRLNDDGVGVVIFESGTLTNGRQLVSARGLHELTGQSLSVRTAIIVDTVAPDVVSVHLESVRLGLGEADLFEERLIVTFSEPIVSSQTPKSLIQYRYTYTESDEADAAEEPMLEISNEGFDRIFVDPNRPNDLIVTFKQGFIKRHTAEESNFLLGRRLQQQKEVEILLSAGLVKDRVGNENQTLITSPISFVDQVQTLSVEIIDQPSSGGGLLVRFESPVVVQNADRFVLSGSTDQLFEILLRASGADIDGNTVTLRFSEPIPSLNVLTLRAEAGAFTFDHEQSVRVNAPYTLAALDAVALFSSVELLSDADGSDQDGEQSISPDANGVLVSRNPQLHVRIRAEINAEVTLTLIKENGDEHLLSSMVQISSPLVENPSLGEVNLQPGSLNGMDLFAQDGETVVLRVDVEDVAGNRASRTLDVRLDLTPPSLRDDLLLWDFTNGADIRLLDPGDTLTLEFSEAIHLGLMIEHLRLSEGSSWGDGAVVLPVIDEAAKPSTEFFSMFVVKLGNNPQITEETMLSLDGTGVFDFAGNELLGKVDVTIPAHNPLPQATEIRFDLSKRAIILEYNEAVQMGADALMSLTLTSASDGVAQRAQSVGVIDGSDGRLIQFIFADGVLAGHQNATVHLDSGAFLAASDSYPSQAQTFSIDTFAVFERLALVSESDTSINVEQITSVYQPKVVLDLESGGELETIFQGFSADGKPQNQMLTVDQRRVHGEEREVVSLQLDLSSLVILDIDGTYGFTFVLTDTSGNKSSRDLLITIDRTPPIVKGFQVIQSPDTNRSIYDTDDQFLITFSEEVSVNALWKGETTTEAMPEGQSPFLRSYQLMDGSWISEERWRDEFAENGVHQFAQVFRLTLKEGWSLDETDRLVLLPEQIADRAGNLSKQSQTLEIPLLGPSFVDYQISAEVIGSSSGGQRATVIDIRYDERIVFGNSGQSDVLMVTINDVSVDAQVAIFGDVLRLTFAADDVPRVDSLILMIPSEVALSETSLAVSQKVDAIIDTFTDLMNPMFVSQTDFDVEEGYANSVSPSFSVQAERGARVAVLSSTRKVIGSVDVPSDGDGLFGEVILNFAGLEAAGLEGLEERSDPYNFLLRSRDRYGNEAIQNLSFTVDVTPPMLEVDFIMVLNTDDNVSNTYGQNDQLILAFNEPIRTSILFESFRTNRFGHEEAFWGQGVMISLPSSSVSNDYSSQLVITLGENPQLVPGLPFNVVIDAQTAVDRAGNSLNVENTVTFEAPLFGPTPVPGASLPTVLSLVSESDVNTVTINDLTPYFRMSTSSIVSIKDSSIPDDENPMGFISKGQQDAAVQLIDLDLYDDFPFNTQGTRDLTVTLMQGRQSASLDLTIQKLDLSLDFSKMLSSDPGVANFVLSFTFSIANSDRSDPRLVLSQDPTAQNLDGERSLGWLDLRRPDPGDPSNPDLLSVHRLSALDRVSSSPLERFEISSNVLREDLIVRATYAINNSRGLSWLNPQESDSGPLLASTNLNFFILWLGEEAEIQRNWIPEQYGLSSDDSLNDPLLISAGDNDDILFGLSGASSSVWAFGGGGDDVIRIASTGHNLWRGGEGSDRFVIPLAEDVDVQEQFSKIANYNNLIRLEDDDRLFLSFNGVSGRIVRIDGSGVAGKISVNYTELTLFTRDVVATVNFDQVDEVVALLDRLVDRSALADNQHAPVALDFGDRIGIYQIFRGSDAALDRSDVNFLALIDQTSDQQRSLDGLSVDLIYRNLKDVPALQFLENRPARLDLEDYVFRLGESSIQLIRRTDTGTIVPVSTFESGHLRASSITGTFYQTGTYFLRTLFQDGMFYDTNDFQVTQIEADLVSLDVLIDLDVSRDLTINVAVPNGIQIDSVSLQYNDVRSSGGVSETIKTWENVRSFQWNRSILTSFNKEDSPAVDFVLATDSINDMLVINWQQTIHLRDYRDPANSLQEQDLQNITGSLIFLGSNAENIISGSSHPDYLAGYGGADQLFGLGGDDTLIDFDGVSLLRGGLGDDQITIAYGIADGGLGDDRITAVASASTTTEETENVLIGGLGSDTIVGFSGADSSSVNDRDRNEVIYAELQTDNPIFYLEQELSHNTIISNGGNDVIHVGFAHADITLGDGEQTVVLASGVDAIYKDEQGSDRPVNVHINDFEPMSDRVLIRSNGVPDLMGSKSYDHSDLDASVTGPTTDVDGENQETVVSSNQIHYVYNIDSASLDLTTQPTREEIAGYLNRYFFSSANAQEVIFVLSDARAGESLGKALIVAFGDQDADGPVGADELETLATIDLIGVVGLDLPGYSDAFSFLAS